MFPGRKPGEHSVFEVKPRRGERSNERSECKPDRAQPVRDGICRTYGAHARKGRNPRACARGYILSPLRGFNRMRFARSFLTVDGAASLSAALHRIVRPSERLRCTGLRCFRVLFCEPFGYARDSPAAGGGQLRNIVIEFLGSCPCY